MTSNSAAVWCFDTHVEAEASLEDLQSHHAGIPKAGSEPYETAIQANRFVVVAHGCAAEMAEAKEILAATQVAPQAAHELPDPPLAGVLVAPGATRGTN